MKDIYKQGDYDLSRNTKLSVKQGKILVNKVLNNFHNENVFIKFFNVIKLIFTNIARTMIIAIFAFFIIIFITVFFV